MGVETPLLTTLARNVASATVAGGEMSNADVLFSQDGWDLGASSFVLFALPSGMEFLYY